MTKKKTKRRFDKTQRRFEKQFHISKKVQGVGFWDEKQKPSKVTTISVEDYLAATTSAASRPSTD